jgi:cyclohexa-1,5-dienecarbonyl-CoA hydratase
MTAPQLRVAVELEGRLLRLTLAAPKANIIDMAMIKALRTAARDAQEMPALRAVLIDHDGPNFSFGASVQEHLPDAVDRMLPQFHGLFADLAATDLPILCAAHGHVLGGGLELAAWCHRVFVTPDARLGQPEVSLGVFAPVGSLALPLRVGQAHADDLLLSGRIVTAEEARAMGLVDVLDGEPAEAALEYVRTHLLPKSAAALRFAVRAARTTWTQTFKQHLMDLEGIYLADLMRTADAVEGLEAFIEKRAPRWKDN